MEFEVSLSRRQSIISNLNETALSIISSEPSVLETHLRIATDNQIVIRETRRPAQHRPIRIQVINLISLFYQSINFY